MALASFKRDALDSKSSWEKRREREEMGTGQGIRKVRGGGGGMRRKEEEKEGEGGDDGEKQGKNPWEGHMYKEGEKDGEGKVVLP